MSAPSLHRESTNSLIIWLWNTYWYNYRRISECTHTHSVISLVPTAHQFKHRFVLHWQHTGSGPDYPSELGLPMRDYVRMGTIQPPVMYVPVMFKVIRYTYGCVGLFTQDKFIPVLRRLHLSELHPTPPCSGSTPQLLRLDWSILLAQTVWCPSQLFSCCEQPPSSPACPSWPLLCSLRDRVEPQPADLASHPSASAFSWLP